MKRRDFIKKAGIVTGVVVAAPLLITSAFAETKPLTKLSSIDQLNARRTIQYIKGQTEDILHQFLFEPNDVSTRQTIETHLGIMLRNLPNYLPSYIQDYNVVCDETNNTPIRIDAGTLYVDMLVKFNRSIDYIHIPAKIYTTKPVGYSRGNGDEFFMSAPFLPFD